MKKSVKLIFFSCICFILILSTSFYAYFYLSKIGKTIILDDSNIPEIILKADNCNSPYVENEVISAFKNIDMFYKNILPKSIDTISIQSKEALLQDENSTKYICKGNLYVQSDKNGFRPLNDEDDNIFYQIAYLDKFKIKKYTYYEIPVFYISQIIQDKNIVEIIDIKEGKFGCTKHCSPIYLQNKTEVVEMVKTESVEPITSHKKETVSENPIKIEKAKTKSDEIENEEIIPINMDILPKSYQKEEKKTKKFNFFQKIKFQKDNKKEK